MSSLIVESFIGRLGQQKLNTMGRAVVVVVNTRIIFPPEGPRMGMGD